MQVCKRPVVQLKSLSKVFLKNHKIVNLRAEVTRVFGDVFCLDLVDRYLILY